MVLRLLLLLAVALVIAFFLSRANELFALRARGGRLELLRGRLPQALFSELDDVARRQNLDAVQVRAVVEGGAPRLVVKGTIGEAAEQQLRNVLGRFQLSQIRSGKLRA